MARSRASASQSRGLRRIDPRDGKLYTKAEFLAWYGGTAEWERAAGQRWRPVRPPAESGGEGEEGGGEVEGAGGEEDEEEGGDGRPGRRRSPGPAPGLALRPPPGSAEGDRARGKVDDLGNFLPYAGVCVACPVLPSEGWVSLPGALHTVAGQWVSPLGAGAYHATVLSGPSQVHLKLGGQEWLEFLMQREERWKEVRSVLETAHLQPRSLELTGLRDPANGWGVCLEFVLKDEAEKLKTQELRQAVRQVAPRCNFEPRDRPWLLTLAYPRRSAGTMPPDVFRTVCGLVQACVQRGPVPLGPACLCFSPNVGELLPWDGTIYDPLADQWFYNACLAAAWPPQMLDTSRPRARSKPRRRKAATEPAVQGEPAGGGGGGPPESQGGA